MSGFTAQYSTYEKGARLYYELIANDNINVGHDKTTNCWHNMM